MGAPAANSSGCAPMTIKLGGMMAAGIGVMATLSLLLRP